MNISNHARGDGFNPYNDFFNMMTFLPYRNAFFTSNCGNSQSKFTLKDNMTHTRLILDIGTNVFV